eukprot:Nk52_evm5s268 gene=Nk52_evmTU5s268
MDPAIAAKTKKALGEYIKKPPLTEKLLSKPPFRFLHDVITETINATGFAEGLYTAQELNSANIKEKEAKIEFLSKIIKVVSICDGKELKVKPSKIVAGHEPEATNEFLQKLGKAIKNGADSKAAVGQALGKKKSSTASDSPKRSKKSSEKVKEKEASSSSSPRGNNSQRPKAPKAGSERRRPSAAAAEEEEDSLRNVRPNSARGHRRPQDEANNSEEEFPPAMQNSAAVEGDIMAGSSRKDAAREDQQQANPPKRMERPSSARMAPPKIRRESEVVEDRVGSGKAVSSVIVENDACGIESSDEEEEALASGMQEVKGGISVNEAATLKEGDHGQLVRGILETKKELSGAPEDSSSPVLDKNALKAKQIAEKETEKLRSSIQALCRSANPLGKILDYIQEDMDSMHKELELWTEENRQCSHSLRDDAMAEDNSLDLLKGQLKELDLAMEDQLDAINAVKANLLKNDEKIKVMLTSIAGH